MCSGAQALTDLSRELLQMQQGAANASLKMSGYARIERIRKDAKGYERIQVQSSSEIS